MALHGILLVLFNSFIRLVSTVLSCLLEVNWRVLVRWKEVMLVRWSIGPVTCSLLSTNPLDDDDGCFRNFDCNIGGFLSINIVSRDQNISPLGVRRWRVLRSEWRIYIFQQNMLRLPPSRSLFSSAGRQIAFYVLSLHVMPEGSFAGDKFIVGS